MKTLGNVIMNKDMTKQFRIVKVREWPDGKGTDSYISKRVIRYQTAFGDNSAGSEIGYAKFNEALKTELKWINEVAK